MKNRWNQPKFNSIIQMCYEILSIVEMHDALFRVRPDHLTRENNEKSLKSTKIQVNYSKCSTKYWAYLRCTLDHVKWVGRTQDGPTCISNISIVSQGNNLKSISKIFPNVSPRRKQLHKNVHVMFIDVVKIFWFWFTPHYMSMVDIDKKIVWTSCRVSG